MPSFGFINKLANPIDDFVTFTKLKRISRLKSADLLKLQDKKIREVIRFSYNNIPYYHELFKENALKPDDVKGTKDLEKVPILTKEKLRNIDPKQLVPANLDLNRCYKLQTSGTSGIPLCVYHDRKTGSMGQFKEHLWQLSVGNKSNSKQVDLSSGWIIKASVLQNLWMRRTYRVSVYDSLEKQVQQIREYDPKSIIAVPSFLAIIARVIRDENIRGINPDFLLTGGELVDSQTRKLLEEVFGAELCDGYGANEVGGIAKECNEHVGYHVWGESNFVEVTRDGEPVSPGEEGEMTVTNFFNRGTVLLRYNLEDIGLMTGETCSCGNHFPLLKLTGGRKIDYMYLPNGQKVSAVPFYKVLVPIEGILQFQMVQEDLNHFTVKVVTGQTFTDNTILEIKSTLMKTIGNIEVDVEIVDRLSKPNYRKNRQFITKLD